MLIIVALGGNALLRQGEIPTATSQRANIRIAATALARIAKGNQLVIVHGNGPQVGMLAKQADAFPLDILDAETQGMIGYQIEQEMRRFLPSGRECVALLTTVEIDADDGAFLHPDKPIGPRFPNKDVPTGSVERSWTTISSGGMIQRVVPSPKPRRIVELGSVQWLLAHECVVICGGGGGIPVTAQVDGSMLGVEAVIDKDRTASMLAVSLHASLLVIATDVLGIYENWGHPTQRLLDRASPAHLASLHFEAGSMGPKVEASCDFVNRTGKRAVIGRLEDIEAMVNATAGTSIQLQSDNAILEQADMTKRPLSATEIHTEVKRRMLSEPASADDPSVSYLPIPRAHPLDAEARNWDMVEVESSGYKRRVIEEARKEFLFSDASEEDERISDAFTKS